MYIAVIIASSVHHRYSSYSWLISRVTCLPNEIPVGGGEEHPHTPFIILWFGSSWLMSTGSFWLLPKIIPTFWASDFAAGFLGRSCLASITFLLHNTSPTKASSSLEDETSGSFLNQHMGTSFWLIPANLEKESLQNNKQKQAPWRGWHQPAHSPQKRFQCNQKAAPKFNCYRKWEQLHRELFHQLPPQCHSGIMGFALGSTFQRGHWRIRRDQEGSWRNRKRARKQILGSYV